jgi:hypothetical protein
MPDNIDRSILKVYFKIALFFGPSENAERTVYSGPVSQNNQPTDGSIG